MSILTQIETTQLEDEFTRLHEQRSAVLKDIANASEPYGLSVEILNARITSLPGIEAAIVTIEDKLALPVSAAYTESNPEKGCTL